VDLSGSEFDWLNAKEAQLFGGFIMLKARCGPTHLTNLSVKFLVCAETRFVSNTDISGTTELGACGFSKCTFWTVSFDGRTFAGNTSFDDAVFEQPPGFHNCKLFWATNFDGAVFKNISFVTAQQCYRSLRHCCKEIESPADELRFFVLEMRAKRHKERNRALRALFGAYEVLSAYGSSIARPVVWFLVVQVLFGAIYAAVHASQIGCFSTIKCGIDAGNAEKLFGFTLAQSLPFIPALKDAASHEVLWEDCAIFSD
jgi:hypothetical protein